MNTFEIIHRGRADHGGYLYEVRKNGRRVAEVRHNHRGEEFEIRVSSLGDWEPCEPIIDGGGPEPLRLTYDGAALLLKHLARPI